MLLKLAHSHQRLLTLIGVILFILGLILTPLIIGLPILLLGWLMITAGYWLDWLNLVPKPLKQDLAAEVEESLQPYKPAIKSLSQEIAAMIKIALFVFITLCGVAVFLILR